MKEAREVIREAVVRIFGGPYSNMCTAEILSALDAAGYEIKQKKCQCGTWGGCELPEHNKHGLHRDLEDCEIEPFTPASSSTKAQR